MAAELVAILVDGLQHLLQQSYDDNTEEEFNKLLEYVATKESVCMGLLPLCRIALVSLKPTYRADLSDSALGAQAPKPQSLRLEQSDPPSTVWQSSLYSQFIQELGTAKKPRFLFSSAVEAKLAAVRLAKEQFRRDCEWTRVAEQHLFVYVVEDEGDSDEDEGGDAAGKWAWLNHGGHSLTPAAGRKQLTLSV